MEKTMSENNKLGLVLEGGGAKGVYQVGALEALKEAGVFFDGVAGTSIGALNGAIIVSEGLEKLSEIWDEVTFSTVFEIDDDWIAKFKKKDFDLDMMTYAGKKLSSLKEVIKDSYVKSEKFIYDRLDENKIRRSKMDFGFVAYNITDMVPVEVMKEDVPCGKLVDYIIASATFPIFPPKDIDGKKYIDGGVYDNMPVNLMGRNGYNKLIVIRTNVESKAPKRCMERSDMDIVYIAPKNDLGKAMAFNEEKFGSMRKQGYNDAMRLLDAGIILPYNE